MSKCAIINQLRNGGIYETVVSFCMTHGIEAPQQITTEQYPNTCVIGKAEAAVRDALAEVQTKLEQIQEALARLDSVNK